MAETIALSGVGYRYDAAWVFRHLSLALAPRQLTAILGPNGCGKSTLLSVLSGHLKPVEGTVSDIDRRLAFVPQSLETSLPITGLDMVLLGRARSVALFSSPRASDYQTAAAALDKLGIAHLAGRDFRVMSGGEKQLVLIARAIVSDCQVLVLDEPTAALDWRRQAKVLNLLRRLADTGLSVVFTTHAPQHALDFADRVLLMPEPTRQLYGVPADILDENVLSQLYRVAVRRIDVAGQVSTAVPVFKETPCQTQELNG